jgi:hypothetical protein
MIPKKPAPELDPGWVAVFRKDHAPAKPYSGMTIRRKIIPLEAPLVGTAPLH